jgi:hypothetical protein
MTTTYTPTPTDHTSIELPADDDTVSAALFAAPLMDLADMVARLKADVGVFSPVLIPLIRNTVPQADGTTPYWAYDGQLDGAGFVQLQSTVAPSLYIELDVQAGQKIIQAGVYCRGTWNGNTHSVHVPGTMPGISIESVDTYGVRTTEFTGQVDTSGTILAYETSHLFSTLPGSVTVLSGHRYFIVVTGEAGSNAEDNAFFVTGAAFLRDPV